MPVIDVSQDANAAAAQVKAACLNTGFFYGEAKSYHMAQHVGCTYGRLHANMLLLPVFQSWHALPSAAVQYGALPMPSIPEVHRLLVYIQMLLAGTEYQAA